MDTPHRQLSPELESGIREVALQLRRRQWIQTWLRFGVASLGIVALATLLLAFSDAWNLPRLLIIVGFLVAESILTWRMVITPMREPLDLRRVAMFIDDQHPELENRLLSAVDFSSRTDSQASDYMIQQVIEESRTLSSDIKFGELVNPGLLFQLVFIAAFFFMLCAAIVIQRFDVWSPARSISESGLLTTLNLLEFEVDPGDVRVRTGDNQTILVRSEVVGKQVALQWRVPEGGQWETALLPQGATDKVHHYQFKTIMEDLEYQIQFGDQRSKIFSITTWTPPEVEAIDLVYDFPEYLDWPSREVPNSGNITAVEGTQVELAVMTNKPIKSATMVREGSENVTLERDSERLWKTSIPVEFNDKYHIELIDKEGEKSEFNPNYTITAQLDNPPEIKINFPKGDTEVSSLEEVPFTFKVTDDFGLVDYGLKYEVVGEGAKLIEMTDTRPELVEAHGEHSFELENMDLDSGDLITWTIWAKDANPARSDSEQYGDVYFLSIRPFAKRYQEAVSNEGGMQGQGGGESSDQKEIIIATWNLKRKARTIEKDKFEEELAVIIEEQVKLLTKFEGAMAMSEQSAEQLEKVMEEIHSALGALSETKYATPNVGLDSALVHMQNAYRWILKLEPKDVQVQQEQSQGQGSGNRRNDEEMSKLEMDRNENFYEEEKRTSEQHESVEEALNKIKALAQRQKIINEEISRLISELEKAETEAEKEKIRRELERLRQEEEKNLENLDEISSDVAQSKMDPGQQQQAQRDLEQTREEMNESLEHLENEDLQKARSAGARAQSRLDQLEEQLESLSRGAAAEMMQELQDRLDQMQADQEEIADGVDSLQQGEEGETLSAAADDEKEREALLKKKKELAEQFTEMMNDAAKLAERSASSQELMSRQLGDWLRETSRDGILEDINESENLLRYGAWDSATNQEKQISRKLDRAADQLAKVAESIVEDDIEGMQKALEKLQDIVQGQAGQQGEEDGQGDQASQSRKRRPGKGTSTDPRDQQGLSNSPGGVPSEHDVAAADQELQAGRQAIQQGNLREGIERLEESLDFDPTNQEARRELARAMAESGQMEEAIDQLAQGLGVSPNDPRNRERLEEMLGGGAADPNNQDQQNGRGAGGEDPESDQKGSGGQDNQAESQDLPGGAGESEDAQGPGQNPDWRKQWQEANNRGEQSQPAPGQQPGQDSEGQTPGESPGQQGQQSPQGQQGEQGQQGQSPGSQDGEQSDPQGQSPGQQPGEQGDPSQQPGQQPGEGQQGQSPSNGQQPGQQPGEQGDQSQQPGQQPNGKGQSGEQQGMTPGGQGQNPHAPPPNQPSSGRGGSRGNPNGSAGTGAPQDNNWEPGPEYMDEFIEQDYAKWLKKIRDAEALLPGDSPHRGQLEKIRNSLESMRQDYRRHSLKPQYEMFLTDLLNPLAETTNELELELMRALKQNEFLLTDKGAVPAKYHQQVADYFESLSATEGTR